MMMMVMMMMMMMIMAPWFYRAKKYLDPRSGQLDNIFSWTVSYHGHSDYQNTMTADRLDYCTWQPAPAPALPAPEDILAGKADLAVWLVSHCQVEPTRRSVAQF